jgi:hypothetical protein
MQVARRDTEEQCFAAVNDLLEIIEPDAPLADDEARAGNSKAKTDAQRIRRANAKATKSPQALAA